MEIHIMMKNIIAWMFIALLPLLGCGGSTADPLSEGWTFYTSGQLQDAHLSFEDAALSGNQEGYVGLGWVCIDLDSIPEADRYFQLAAADSIADGYAGWSAVLWARSDYSGCILKSDFVLRNDPAYTFDYKPSINAQDMIWYQASSYLHQANYSLCLAKIKALDGSFNANVNDADISDQLAAKLESLAGQLF